MDIYLVSEECHGLIGIFSTEEKGIDFLKEKWYLRDSYNRIIDDYGDIEISNVCEPETYFTIEKKELDKPL